MLIEIQDIRRVAKKKGIENISDQQLIRINLAIPETCPENITWEQVVSDLIDLEIGPLEHKRNMIAAMMQDEDYNNLHDYPDQTQLELLFKAVQKIEEHCKVAGPVLFYMDEEAHKTLVHSQQGVSICSSASLEDLFEEVSHIAELFQDVFKPVAKMFTVHVKASVTGWADIKATSKQEAEKLAENIGWDEISFRSNGHEVITDLTVETNKK